jgi:hypothetical protein
MKDQIVGSWRLESFEIEEPSKRLRPWGENTQGLLIYTPDGFMSVGINREIENKSGNETKDVFDSILFYSGTYSVQKSEIHHQVTHASDPKRIGKNQIRYASLEGDKLTLKSPVESFGQAILVWRKN